MIKKIEHSQIPFLENKECKRLGITFNKTYQYLGYFDENGDIIGVVGWKSFKSSAYIGGSFVDESNRLKGIYTELNNERFKHIQGKVITANCTKNSLPFHLKNGAKVIKEYKNGIKKIIYEKDI